MHKASHILIVSIPWKWFALHIILVEILNYGYNFESRLTSLENGGNLMKHVKYRKHNIVHV